MSFSYNGKIFYFTKVLGLKLYWKKGLISRDKLEIVFIFVKAMLIILRILNLCNLIV